LTHDDRRTEPRYATAIDVDYLASSTFLIAQITDISSLGIFIRTDDPLPVGTALELRFTPPAIAGGGDRDVGFRQSVPATPLQLRGEVMWNTLGPNQRGNPGMGVRFIDLDPKTRSKLLDLVHAIAYLDSAGETPPG
jgi:type IV pilus assembly protein PilZ